MHHSTLAFVAFLLIVIGVYVAAHSYIYYRMRTSLELGKAANLIIGIFFIIMIFSPFIIRISENRGLNTVSVFFSYTGYMWMGIISIMVLSLFALDILSFATIRIFRYLSIKRDFLEHLPRYTFLLSFFLSLLASAIGFFEAKNIKITRVRLESKNLRPNYTPLRIVQISDIHISQTLGGEFISAVAKKISELKPDIIAVTGDITDIDPRKNKKIISTLSSLNPPLGKYAVTGNHEFYAGIEMAMDFYSMCGIRLLKGETATPVEGIIIAGIDDDNGRRFTNFSDTTEDKLFNSSEDNNNFVILLKHKPFVHEDVKDKIDLQLSGHTHRGQIFPFSLIVRQVYRYFYGLYRISDRMNLYVSGGTGYWGPPIRFLAPPEITLFEINRKD
ncbi:MAG: metallophosphoesterase [Deltaproteobacteria bacterium]|nr:metallophosphoesterase [Deltaproteobacteria bacterium]